MQYGPGVKLVSQVCATMVVVVRPPDGDIEISCGGRPMLVPDDGPQDRPVGDSETGPQLGKRYYDPSSGFELLCTQSGVGPLCVDGRAVELKESRPLPAAD